jgi:hypothetical protein
MELCEISYLPSRDFQKARWPFFSARVTCNFFHTIFENLCSISQNPTSIDVIILIIIKNFEKSDAPINRHGNENVKMLELGREKMGLTICSTRITTHYVPMRNN